MSMPSTLAEAACLNARKLLADVVRSFRRAGDYDTAREIVRTSRLLGTYPFAPATRA